MKTAISIPDPTYERASRRARELGLSRSELFSRAVTHYLDQLEDEAVTEAINRALDLLNEGADGGGSDAVAAGHRLLAGLADDW